MPKPLKIAIKKLFGKSLTFREKCEGLGIERNGYLKKITLNKKDKTNKHDFQLTLLEKRKFMVRRGLQKAEKKLKLATEIINKLESKVRNLGSAISIKGDIDVFALRQVAKYTPTHWEYRKVAVDARNYAKINFIEVYQEYIKKHKKKLDDISKTDVLNILREAGKKREKVLIYGDRVIVNLLGQKSTKRKIAGL